MDEFLSRMLAKNLSDFRGLSIEGTVPMRENVINEAIALELQNNKKVKYCLVSIDDLNIVEVRVGIVQWIVVPIKFKARVDKTIYFTDGPKIRIYLSEHAILTRLVEIVGSISFLPAGIAVDKNVITIDLVNIQQGKDWQALIRHMKWSEIVTTHQVVYLNFKIVIE